MARTLLQDMVEGRNIESLPANWSSFDLKSFSRQKQLWGYQQQAVTSKEKRPARGVSPEMLSLEEQYTTW